MVDMGFWGFSDLMENVWDGEFWMPVFLHKKSFYLFYTFLEGILVAINKNFWLLILFAGNGYWRFVQTHLWLFLTSNFFGLLFGWFDSLPVCDFKYLSFQFFRMISLNRTSWDFLSTIIILTLICVLCIKYKLKESHKKGGTYISHKSISTNFMREESRKSIR